MKCFFILSLVSLFCSLSFISCKNENKSTVSNNISDKVNFVNNTTIDDKSALSILKGIAWRIDNNLIFFNDNFYYINIDDDQSVYKLIIDGDFQITNIQKGKIVLVQNSDRLDSLIFEFIFNNEIIIFPYKDLQFNIRKLSYVPDTGQTLYYAIYTERKFEAIRFRGDEFEEKSIKRKEELENTYLVLFDNTGNKRFISYGNKLLFEVPSGGGISLLSIGSEEFRRNENLFDIEPVFFIEVDYNFRNNSNSGSSYFIQIDYKALTVNENFALE